MKTPSATSHKSGVSDLFGFIGSCVAASCLLRVTRLSHARFAADVAAFAHARAGQENARANPGVRWLR